MLLFLQVKIVDLSTASSESAIANFLSYLEKNTGVPKTTIFTVFTSLFVFGLGVLTKYIINKLKERNQRTNYKRTISLLLGNLGMNCKKQHERTRKILGKTSILDNKTLAIQDDTAHNYFRSFPQKQLIPFLLAENIKVFKFVKFSHHIIIN